MRPVTIALALALLITACKKGEQGSPPQTTSSLAELKEKVSNLEWLRGEDAYDRPEMAELMRELARIPPGSPDYEEARKLLEFLRAKRRIAQQAKEPLKPEQVIGAQHVGPIAMAGAEPTSAEAVKKIGVGSTREELVSAYGACLVRQTWFRGEGGPTTELFHVAPSCRERLGKHVFRVTNGRVDQRYEGTLDGLMTTAHKDSSADEERRE